MSTRPGAEIVKVFNTPADYLTQFGLGHPTSRFLTMSAALGTLAYVTKVQPGAFRKDGTSKPLTYASYQPDAVSLHKHFLFIPVATSFLVVACLT